MARRSTIRASDADREHVAERLRAATAEGRLLAEELEQRLEAAFSARTYGELDVLVADLPGRRDLPARGRTRPLARVRQIPAPALIVLIPVALALAMAAVVVLVTLFTIWAVVVAIGWLAFGPRRPHYARRHYHRAMHEYHRTMRQVWRA